MSDTAIEELEPESGDDVETSYLAAEKEDGENCTVDCLLNQFWSRQRKALTLYYIEEKKYEDIAIS